MKLTLETHCSNLCVASVAALSVTSFWFWLTWRYGFDLADEGYYWYGAQRVLRGEVPMRDFMSYDIGRYYWAASFMYLLGDDGIFPARLSAAAYQFFGNFVGAYICLLALRQFGFVRWIFALLVTCILTIWVDPYYKVYDHATSIITLATLVLMMKVTKPTAWLISGVWLGIAAMLGRNHGVYGTVAAMFLVSILFIKAPSRRAIAHLFGYYALGVLIGFSPTLIMMIFIQGFFSAFIDSIVTMFQYGSTNLGLPIPWPWSAKWEWVGLFWTARMQSTGIGFVFLLAFPLLGILAMAYRRFDLSNDTRKVFLAAIVTSIPYAHYAFSRADITHLALGIFPALIGLFAACGAFRKLQPLFVGFVMLVLSMITLGNSQIYLPARLFKQKVLQADVGGQNLWMTTAVFNDLKVATYALSNLTDTSFNFLALPNLPSVYAIYRAKIPIWEIYSLIPRSADFEAEEIKRLESDIPSLVLLSDHALDQNPEFRFSRMHPLIYAWILSRYRLADSSGNPEKSDIKVYFPRHEVKATSLD